MSPEDLTFILSMSLLPLWWAFVGFHLYGVWLKDGDVRNVKLFKGLPDKGCVIAAHGILVGLVWTLVSCWAGVIVEDFGVGVLFITLKTIAILAVTIWLGIKAARIHKRLYKMRDALKEKCSFFRELCGKEKDDG
jgi:hypothetical protein